MATENEISNCKKKKNNIYINQKVSYCDSSFNDNIK